MKILYIPSLVLISQLAFAGVVPAPELDKPFVEKLQAATKPTQAAKDAAVTSVQTTVAPIIAPATPEEIRVTKELVRQSERIENERQLPLHTVTRDVYWTVGDQPPVVNLLRGFTTTLVFFGSGGQPLILNAQGIKWGDSEALNPEVYMNTVTLTVKKPWRVTNGTLFFNDFYVPMNITFLPAADDMSDTVDYQVRIHVLPKVEARELAPNRPDMHDMSLLLKLISGLTSSDDKLTPLTIASVEKADINGGIRWIPIRADVAQVFLGSDNRTYVVLRPGLALKGADYLALQPGPDGSMGYILAGNQPRVFTAMDTVGGAYRIIVQR